MLILKTTLMIYYHMALNPEYVSTMAFLIHLQGMSITMTYGIDMSPI